MVVHINDCWRQELLLTPTVEGSIGTFAVSIAKSAHALLARLMIPLVV